MDASKYFGLIIETVGTLPRIQTYPSYHGNQIITINKTGFILLRDLVSASRAGLACHGSLRAMQEYITDADPGIWRSRKKELDKL